MIPDYDIFLKMVEAELPDSVTAHRRIVRKQYELLTLGMVDLKAAVDMATNACITHETWMVLRKFKEQ